MKETEPDKLAFPRQVGVAGRCSNGLEDESSHLHSQTLVRKLEIWQGTGDAFGARV